MNKSFAVWTALVLVLVPGVAAAQSSITRERSTYDTATAYSVPDSVQRFIDGAGSQSVGDKVLPWPYFHMVKANESNLRPEFHELLRPISSNGLILCDEEKNAYSLAARQWQGMSDPEAAYDIARVLKKLNAWRPCGYRNHLVLSDMHFSLRTATNPEKREPSWILRWTDQFGFYHYGALKASSAVYQSAGVTLTR